MRGVESLREFLFEDFIRLFAESKGVVLDSGVIIDPRTDRRYEGNDGSIMGLAKSAKRGGKFFGVVTAGNSEELRGSLELMVKDADFSKSEDVQDEPFKIRRYPGVKSDGLDFRVYASVFGFFKDGIYHEIDLIAPETARKAAELKRHIRGSPVLAKAIGEGYNTPYTNGFLVFTLPNEEYAQQVEEAMLKVIRFYDVDKYFKVRRKERRVYNEPRTMDDGETEVNKYNAVSMGGARASEFAGEDYSIDCMIYVTYDANHPSEMDMQDKSTLVFGVDEVMGHKVGFLGGMPPIVSVGSSQDAFCKIRDGLTMSTRPEIAKRVYDAWNRRQQEREIAGMPVIEALNTMGLVKDCGESLRSPVPPRVMGSYIHLARNGAKAGAQLRAP